MHSSFLKEFCLEQDIVYLNHASYGAPLRRLMDLAETYRLSIEMDTATKLGQDLRNRLHDLSVCLSRRLGMIGGQTTLIGNATEACNTLAASYPLSAGDHVAVLSTEYSSVIETWRVWTKIRGATIDILPIHFPVTIEQAAAAVRSCSKHTKVIVISAIASSSGLVAPLQTLMEECNRRNIDVIVDAAHVVGHADYILQGIHPYAVFGSLHKWLPIPRPVGFLWIRHDLEYIKPDMVTLHREAPRLTDRFSWRGTWDPASQLTLPEGLKVADEWHRDGLDKAAETLATTLSDELEDLGLIPCVDSTLLAPRLRAFQVKGVHSTDIKRVLFADGIRVWAGEDTESGCIFRISTHVYNTREDTNRLLTSLHKVV